MTVGWYVHHHGAGHLHRFLAVRPHLDHVVGLSSLPAPDDGPWVELPLDVPAGPASEETAGGVLHWAPLQCDGLRARMAAIAAWIERERPSALVVDVSVEVALLARLLGVPTVVVAQRGVRDDEPHRLAYASASAIVAPWTREAHLAGEGPPDERLTFTGAISRFDGLDVPPPGEDVVVLLGGGGHGVRAEDVERAAEADRDRRWHVAGPLRVAGGCVVDHGEHADVWSLLGRAGVVVGSAGGNVVAEVAAARRPLVCLPQDRPFAEQHRQAEALRRLGVASVHERWPADWDRAVAGLDPSRWAQLHDGCGAERLAAAVREVTCA